MTDAPSPPPANVIPVRAALERRLFATLFEGADPSGVVDALRGYQNPMVGFAHGLEPDKICPASLPIDSRSPFQTLADAGTTDEQMSGGRATGCSRSPPGRGRRPGLPVIEQ